MAESTNMQYTLHEREKINDVNVTASMMMKLFGFHNIYIDTVTTAYAGSRSNTANNSTRFEGLTQAQSHQAIEVLSKVMRDAKK